MRPATSSPMEIPGSSKENKALSVNSDVENSPPNSRLFVLCDKHATEEDIIEFFSNYGNIEYCKVIKNKNSNLSKGFCYVKFDKASSAALAIERAEGERIGNYEFPTKLEIAAAKGKKKIAPVVFSSEPEDTPPRSRLFVVCPKELTESEIHAAFAEFENYDYSKVILDKISGISKGFAYVKFTKASSAAVAMEDINERGTIGGRQVKVIVADPKSKAKPDNHVQPEAVSYFSASGSPPSPYFYPVPFHYMRTQINAECDGKLVSQADISQLFSRFDGFEYCDFTVVNTASGEVKGISQIFFSDPQRAAVAAESLNGTEISNGAIIRCNLCEPSGYPMMPMLANSPPAGTFYPFMMPGNQYQFYPPTVYPQYPHGMEQSNDQAHWIQFTSNDPLSPDFVGITFSRFGMVEYMRMDNENSGTIRFFDPFSAFAAARELNGKQINGIVLNVYPHSN